MDTPAQCNAGNQFRRASKVLRKSLATEFIKQIVPSALSIFAQRGRPRQDLATACNLFKSSNSNSAHLSVSIADSPDARLAET
jgi:hypothetical protein